MWQRQIESLLKEVDVKIVQNAEMSSLTSIRCGGAARLLIEPGSTDALVSTVHALVGCGVRYKVVGGMTNTLPCDGVFDGALIRTQRINRIAFTENKVVAAETGAYLSTIASFSAHSSLGGLEELAGIPGSLGGAIYGNAGANGKSISDVLRSVTAYDVETGETRSYLADELGFGYRESIFKSTERYVILSAEINLEERAETKILRRIKELAQRRRSTQPLDMPSLGSVFKHPEGHFAPKLIEELGMKGVAVGGALISEKHAGFIVNTGNATAKDVTDLIKLVKNRVMSSYGILLEEEINIIH